MGGSAEELQTAQYLAKKCEELGVTATIEPFQVDMATMEKATLTVQATGEGLTYEWYYANPDKDTFTKTDAFTSNSYSVEMNESRAGRRVYCVVTDKYGKTDKSDVVTLQMGTPLKITTQPKTTYTKQGSTVKVSLAATGDGLTYQWYIKNKGSDKFVKSSITDATYTVKMAKKVDGRQAYCVVKDKYGKTVKSDVITLNMK